MIYALQDHALKGVVFKPITAEPVRRVGLGRHLGRDPKVAVPPYRIVRLRHAQQTCRS
jgi:hypothetical protein